MALGALKDRKMLGAHEGSPNADGHLVAWVSAGGKAMRIAAAQPDIPWTDLAYSLQPNGHTLDYVADAPYLERGRIGIMKQSFVTALYAVGQALSNYAAPGTDPDADLVTWFAAINAGEPYDGNPLSEDIVDEITRHHSSYYIDDSTPPAPMLISNGFTDDLFPTDEAIRFYNRTRTNHPGTPIALIFSDHGHMRGQNKAPDLIFQDRALHAWFDFYLQGLGSQPFLGVRTLTQTCPSTSPSGSFTGPFDDPDTDLPFQAATWASLAPGEVRVEAAAAQTIAPTVPSDGPVGHAFDPVTGGGACATASSADQTGAATYRSDPVPTGGFTLMGAPTVVADIASAGPTSQIAARLLDVDPTSSTERLVARGLYRPEIDATATCQVFQLHPNGWHFADGHVVKLELLPADQPYGRNSNGQLPVTVANLRLRLPVLEAPDGMTIDPPSGKVLPPGYALATDVPNVIDETCVLATGNLHVTRAKITAQSASGGNGSIRASGDFSGPPAFDFPPPFIVRVQDGGALDRSHTFTSCTSSKGRIRCRDSAADGQFKATIKPRRNAAGTTFGIVFGHQAIGGPFAAPITVTITHDAGAARSDSIASCQPTGRGIKCREP